PVTPVQPALPGDEIGKQRNVLRVGQNRVEVKALLVAELYSSKEAGVNHQRGTGKLQSDTWRGHRGRDKEEQGKTLTVHSAQNFTINRGVPDEKGFVGSARSGRGSYVM